MDHRSSGNDLRAAKQAHLHLGLFEERVGDAEFPGEVATVGDGARLASLACVEKEGSGSIVVAVMVEALDSEAAVEVGIEVGEVAGGSAECRVECEEATSR